MFSCVGCQAAPQKVASPEASQPAPTPSSAPAATSVAEPPRLALRTGSVAPVVHETSWPLEVVGRTVDGDVEILELSLPPFQNVVDVPADFVPLPNMWEAAQVQVASEPGAFAFVGWDRERSGSRASVETERAPRGDGSKVAAVAPALRVWLRRPASNSLPTGVLFSPGFGIMPGHRIPFHADKLPPATKDGTRTKNWAAAAANFFAARPGAFYQFAANRLRARYLAQKPGTGATASAHFEDELAALMGTFSGRRALQEALEHRRPLYVAASRAKANVPIDKVRRPALLRHPWSEMSQALAKPSREEPLARATPAEFYFARVNGFARFLELLDWVSDWGEPAADLVDGHSEARGTLERYQDELGVEATGLARVFGPSVIQDVALVGSDPYVHEGSDVTLIFRLKDGAKAAFETGLAAALAARAARHEALERTSFEHEGVQVEVTQSRDRGIRRHRASVNGFELLSNSKAAIQRVLSTLGGHHPSLAGQPDFRYFTARDAELRADAFAFVGDEFVAAVTGPAQKIAEARRQLALSELSTPGYAALLAGWLDGKAPASTKALQAAKWLAPSDLRHADGAPIRFEPGRGASSSHGSPARLEPLIDAPPIARVTAAEQRAYEGFARGYESLWSERIDPIGLSLELSQKANKNQAAGAAGGPSRSLRTLSADLRVLPLLRREYRDAVELVGDGRVAAPVLANGARVVAALGKNAGVRQYLQEFGEDFLRDRKLRFDWLGDYVVLGASNRNELGNGLLPLVQAEIERPRPVGEWERDAFEPTTLPLYAIVELKSSVTAALALTALRQKASEVAPGAIEWGHAAAYRTYEVVKVSARERRERITLYYALLPSAFVIALNEASLHEALDQVLDHPPVTQGLDPAARARSGQLLIELASDPSAALHRLAAAFATARLLGVRAHGAALAEAVLRGAPETQGSPERARSLAREYFGVVPLTPDGREYAFSPEGARDPVRGTDYAPTYPDVPVPGSPLQRVLGALRYARSEQSFDPEPGHTPEQPRQSLHIKLSLTTLASEK